MTAIDILDPFDAPQNPAVRPSRPWHWLGRQFRLWRRARRRRAVLLALSELEPHLLRDMGFNPTDLQSSFVERNRADLFDTRPQHY